MTYLIRTAAVVIAVLLLASCQKKDTVTVDLSKVTVSYNQPLDGLTFHKGDTVNIDANISYTNEINGVKIEIIDTGADNIMYHDDQDLHTDRFNLRRSWVDTYSNTASLKVMITVAVANSTKFAENSIHINSHP
jgi:hypothetical protein